MQTRSGVAPKAPPALPKTGSVRPSAAPKSQPPSADDLRAKLDNAKRSTLRPPRLPREADALPIVPQWEANATPLKPAAGERKQFWLRLVGTGFTAGFFAAAGYLGAVAQQPMQTSALDFGVQHVHAQRSLTLPLTAAAPKMAAPVLTSTVRQQPMAAESPVVTLAAAVAASAPVANEAAKAEADASVAKTNVKAAKKTRSTRTLHSKTKVAAPVAQADEEEDSDSSDTEADEPEAPVARTAPAENLPEQPTRGDVQKGLEGVRSVLASCAAGQHGTTYANVTIMGSGHVTYSTVEGAFSGTPAGSCMARALRSSDFPKFSGAPLKVRYPFVF